MRFSANLGFLWNDLPLPLAIEKAAASGFNAVEFHWPYEYDATEIACALKASGLPAIGINAPYGDLANGDFGLAALAGRENEARAAFDLALDYAAVIGCPNVHVLAGKTARNESSDGIFVSNLEYACGRADDAGVTVLIEPINALDVPGYYLNTVSHALEIVELVNAPNLKIMFDCFHVAKMGGDVFQDFEAALPKIGHVQFAGVPDRGEPDSGTVDFGVVLRQMAAMGWAGYFGAEYRPANIAEPDLRWLSNYQKM